MRLLVMSDLCLNLAPFDFPSPLPKFDVAVFAGDIESPVDEAVRWLNKQQQGPLSGRPVIYVPGNRDFYGTEMKGSRETGLIDAEIYGINLLSRASVILDNVRFIGCTLWTDYQLLENPIASMKRADRELEDHLLIYYRESPDDRGYSRFTPRLAVVEHRLDLTFINRELAKAHDGPTVVVTHHAPHPNSIQPQCRSSLLSAAFASDLSDTINKYQPDLWIHGHDHGYHDCWVGRTRIFANQAGHPNPSLKKTSRYATPCVIEIEHRRGCCE